MCLTKASNMWTVTFFLMTISLFFLLPLIILVVLYAIIAKNLIASNNSRMKIRLSKPELSFKARKQVVLMLGAVVFAFFTCLLPFRMLTLWIILVSEETFQKLAVEKYYNLLYFSRIMLYLNSAVNPILYNLMSSKFRKGFLRLCKCTRLCSRSGRRGGKMRGRSATFTTTTTSSYLTSSSIRKNSEKYTLSLDDLRFHQLQKEQSNGILTANKTAKPAIDSSEDGGSGGASDEEGPFQLSRFYRMNLLRLYSTPLLVYDEDRQTAVPFPTGINNNRSSEEGATKRQIGVTFKEANADDDGASIENSSAGEAVRSDLPNPCKLSFGHQQQQQQRWQCGGKISLSPRQTKQMSLDESLLARSNFSMTTGEGITSKNV